ncbi:hypothetical protein RP20_CCG001767 [Aedes albopictus]|nr:hypothetical protein RP20_CCG001767 [Aedes albopictus]
MDFGKLLSVAQRNATNSEQKNSESRYYSTKFAPPKKESKDKKLSANIQKFLAKKEEEERQKALEEKRKRDELMAKRDPKAKKKIEKMLKVIKSANKSVLDDAVDRNDTAVTLQGPEQPDEDDYGYTSNVASQLYQQLMDKYKNTPEEKKFKDGAKRVMSKEEMERAKARVKDALNRVEEEENAPRTRKRKEGGEGTTREEEGTSASSTKRGPDRYDPEEERRKEAEAKAKEEAARKKARRPAGPAPPDFATLLKLAEQKQMEPVKVEVPVIEKKKEPERLMTKKEKKEYEERQAYLEQKKIRDRIRNDPRLSEKERQIKLAQYDAMKAGKIPPAAASTNKPGSTSTNVMAPNGRIPKLNSSSTGSEKPSAAPPKPTSASSSSRPPSSSRPDEKRSSLQKPSPSTTAVPGKSKLESALTASKKPPTSSTAQSSSRDSSSIRKPSVPSSQQQNGSPKISKPPQAAVSAKPTSSSSVANGQKTRPFPPADVPQKTRQFPPSDVQKTRQFPPPDVVRKRPLDARGGRPSSSSSAPAKKRRPVIDSDSEYDSEMDDFIDDGDDEMDYSSQIKAIFGYDKSRYRDEDFDDRQMESTFAQQMREEFISKKIGLMEDLEDMRMEEEEKRQKALKKKQAAKRK